MAAVRVEMEPGWMGHVREAEFVFFDQQLGPDMLQDAHIAVPKLTGRLDASLDYQVLSGDEGAAPILELGSYPDADGDVEYAAAVELGFHGEEYVREHVVIRGFGPDDTPRGYFVRAFTRMGNSPEQPYLRAALYRRRYGS